MWVPSRWATKQRNIVRAYSSRHANDHRTRRAQAGRRARSWASPSWHEVTQKDIDAFADATGDHQWIHVDPERAKDTPFGGTIAHGYYTLSLAPKLIDEIFKMDGFAFAVNYGLNKVRFPAPVPVDRRCACAPSSPSSRRSRAAPR